MFICLGIYDTTPTVHVQINITILLNIITRKRYQYMAADDEGAVSLLAVVVVVCVFCLVVEERKMALRLEMLAGVPRLVSPVKFAPSDSGLGVPSASASCIGSTCCCC